MEDTWWVKPEQLDETQQKVVELALTGNYLISGPPGSGKTNLLLLRAKYLDLAGFPNIAILVFTRNLREFIAAGCNAYNFSSDRIQTYIKWGMSILDEQDIKLEEKEDFQKMRAELTENLAKLKPVELFDCILLDEAQDYSEEEVEIFKKFSKQIYAVGDSHQTIHDLPKNGYAKLQEFCQLSDLKYHYRNGRKICRFADGLKDQLDSPQGMEASSQYDEKLYPSSVKCDSFDNIEEQTVTCVEYIKTQLKAYPNSWIGVLCPSKKDLETVWLIISKSEIESYCKLQKYEEYSSFENNRRIIVTSIHAAKGLEFRAIHLLGMEKVKVFKKYQKKITYTAVTRAKTSLNIYYSGQDLPPHLKKGKLALEDTPSKPKIKDLFR